MIKSPLWDLDKTFFIDGNILVQSKSDRIECQKVYFLSRKEANKRLKDIIMNGEMYADGKKPVRSYECDKCGFWHLTSQENR